MNAGSDITTMNLKTMRKHAKELGIASASGMTKKQLVDAINQLTPAGDTPVPTDATPKKRRTHGRRYKVADNKDMEVHTSPVRSWNHTRTRTLMEMPPQLRVLVDELLANHVGRTGTLRELADTVQVPTRQTPYRIIAWYRKNLQDLGVLVEQPKA